ncbi:MAG: glycosyl transferase [Clostridia bacterium]|nr:glycosyl transferase [Clostridia bacterium]
MKKIACFSIPAHGHTNPMLPVAAALVRRGDRVRFYSFAPFEEKIRKTGAEYVSCDAFLPELSAEEEAQLKAVNTTEMTLQDLKITMEMDEFLGREFREFRPDAVYTDSVCFWGKLSAIKHGVPAVVSTSTFAFNKYSSGYMKRSPKETAQLVFGLPKMSKALKELEPYGYHVKSFLSLVVSDNDTDSVVYTSQRFQPCALSFSEHYAFVGPSVFSAAAPEKEKGRPLVYISMGTVLNDCPDFYRKCIEALKDSDLDVRISCGSAVDPASFAPLPANIRMDPYVDQPEVLAGADVFLTHCGMNSVSESLYMATPMVLFPQTAEQEAVARRVNEIGAGVRLKEVSAGGIRKAVETVLSDSAFARAAAECSRDFRACPGPEGAASFIENAPHTIGENAFLNGLKRRNFISLAAYLLAVVALVLAVGFLAGWKYVWIVGAVAGVLRDPVSKMLQKCNYNALSRKYRSKNGV